MPHIFEAPENNWKVEQFKDNSNQHQQTLIYSILTQKSLKYFRKEKESINHRYYSKFMKEDILKKIK